MSKNSLSLVVIVLAAAFAFGACGKDDASAGKDQSGTKRTEPAVDASQNAAVHYHKVFELMKFDAKTHPAAGPVPLLMMMGWEEHGTPELEEVLDEDREAFAEFEKALKLERCDFTFGTPQFLYRNGDSARTKKIWSLTCLNLVKARYDEFKGRGLDAVEGCLNQLKFMEHVAQGRTFIDKVTALSLEERTFNTLRGMLKNDTLDKAARTRLISGLENLEKNRYPLSEIMEGEREYYLFIVDTVARKIAEDLTPGTAEADQAATFREKLIAGGRHAADHYYGLVSKAYASRSDEDWNAVAEEAKSMREGGREFRSTVRSTDDLLNYTRNELKNKGVESAAATARQILGLYTSDAKGMLMTYEKLIRTMKDCKREAGGK